MATGTEKGTNESTSSESEDTSSNQDENFECNICLDKAKDAVISLCGHLFCWPCLHRWLEMKPHRQVCPVCKTAINREKVIPLYGRGGSNRDPREKLPPRPTGQRTEPTNYSGQTFPAYTFGDGGFHMSFGIGAFPFGFFTSSFNFGDGRNAAFPSYGEIAEEQILTLCSNPAEEYKKCGCEIYCNGNGRLSPSCPFFCREKCVCRKGFFRNRSGQCIPAQFCH